ncbi:MAG: hypothetical protein ACXAEX_03045 [Promethearchaeota archaeon]|jgi:hypothetical protein
MEHTSLTLEDDAKLIDNIMDDVNMRYILLFLYIIRNDLFKDLNDDTLIESYNRILNLDEIYKNNIVNVWDEEFTGIYIDLGLIKNVRSIREFDQKDDDYVMKLGEETVTIEQDTVSVPDDTLYLIISKKFKFLTRRNFNLALTRLKGVRCEKSSTIHSLIYEIGGHDYTLSDDLYYILDQFGNIFQTIKIEITIEGFYQRFKDIKEKLSELISIFDPIFNTKQVIKKIENAIEEKKDIIVYLKEAKIELSDKFNPDKISKEDTLYIQWNSTLLKLLEIRNEMGQIERKLDEIKRFYSGKNKEFKYLEFIERVTYNEQGILDIIQEGLIKLRKELVDINEDISELTKKEVKLLNLDYERLIITSSDN